MLRDGPQTQRHTGIWLLCWSTCTVVQAEQCTGKSRHRFTLSVLWHRPSVQRVWFVSLYCSTTWKVFSQFTPHTTHRCTQTMSMPWSLKCTVNASLCYTGYYVIAPQMWSIPRWLPQTESTDHKDPSELTIICCIWTTRKVRNLWNCALIYPSLVVIIRSFGHGE